MTVADFIAAVREQSLHGSPNLLYRQVTLVWNEAARDAGLGLQSLTVPSFRGPPKRIDWALLSSSFRRDVDKFLKWASQSDPFEPEFARDVWRHERCGYAGIRFTPPYPPWPTLE